MKSPALPVCFGVATAVIFYFEGKVMRVGLKMKLSRKPSYVRTSMSEVLQQPIDKGPLSPAGEKCHRKMREGVLFRICFYI